MLYSVKGTNPFSLKDLGTDIYLASGHLKDTSRFREEKNNLEKAKKRYNPTNTTIAGHSLGASLSQYIAGKDDKVFCFIGDMAFETGGFYEMHKYAIRYDLPIIFIVEDNGVSTNTPTEATWNGEKREIPSEKVIWYSYEKQWPHYGTGKWVVF